MCAVQLIKTVHCYTAKLNIVFSNRMACRCAGDFETSWSRYEPHQLYYTLRAFGHLNYVPPNSSGFFGAVERVLLSRFTEFEAAFILELLVSFVYVERFPANFTGHVFSPHFLMQIKGRTAVFVHRFAR